VSLLADLLSKVKYQGFKSDVPPNLKHAVLNSSEKYAVKKRIIFLSVLIFAAVVSGAGAVYIMSFYARTHEIKKPVRQIEKFQEHIIKSAPSIPSAAAPLPDDITSEPAKEQAGGAGIQKEKTKKDAVVQRVKRQRKTLKKEGLPSVSEPKTDELFKDAGDKKRLPNENQLKRDAHISAAQTFESKRDYRNALASYKKALGVDPENHIILNNISSMLLRLDSYNEAVRYLKNALSIEKDYVPSLVNLGIAYAMLGNFAESESYLTKALSIEPSNVHALLNFAILHERRGDNDKAYSFFYKLSQMGNIQGYLGIARIAEKQGKLQDAVKIYREIMSMNGIEPGIKKFVDERLLHLGR
jgi:tetratricopeptide (TPR) repeat protein